jgi:hypothetical protein
MKKPNSFRTCLFSIIVLSIGAVFASQIQIVQSESSNEQANSDKLQIVSKQTNKQTNNKQTNKQTNKQ